MLNNESNKKYLKNLEIFICNKFNLINIERELYTKYSNILKPRDDSDSLQYFSVINELILNKLTEEELHFLENNDDNMSNFIENTYKKVITLESDYLYNPNIRNIVKKSSILISFSYIEDFNTVALDRLIIIDKLEKELSELEKDMELKLNNPVKIVYDKKVIPPKSFT